VDDLAGNSIAANSQSPFTFVTIQTKDFQDGVLPTTSYAGTRDAYIYEGDPDTGFGTATTLLADGSDPADSLLDLSTLLLWDVSDIPSDALVDGASLTINVTNVSSTGYEIYQVLANWQETSVTWNSAAAGTPWQSPGASGASDRGATVLGVVNGAVTGSHTLALNQAGLDVVQSWIDGSAANNGLVIADSSASNGLDFSSREAGGLLDRPKLSVTYSLPSGGPDTQPPSPPSALISDSQTDTNISLSWQACASAPCDNVGVTGYKVYRDTLLVGSPTTASFLDSGLTPSTLYNYEVGSVDAAGNESLANPTLAVTTDVAAAPMVLVNDIAMSLQSNRKLRFGRAQVTVLDNNAQPVSGVAVSGSWSGLTNASETLDTATDGTVRFDSAQVPKSESGNFAFAVTDLVEAGYTYDETANVETSDCIDTGGADCSGDPGDPAPAITMHATTPTMTAIASRKHWLAEAALPVTEADNVTPVSGATVIGDWTFQAVGDQPVALGSTSAVTDSLGIARVLSPKQRANLGDTFTFVLMGVSKTNAQFESFGTLQGTATVQ
jgi:hypothetical protein